MGTKTKVVSFFSYKGGAGRSTLAYNTIPLLVNEHIHPTKESPVVIIDLDIDSCGMSYLLGIDACEIEDTACVQHVLKEGCDPTRKGSITEHEVLKDMIPVGNKFGYPINEAVLFLPAQDNKDVQENSNFSNYGDARSPFEDRLKSFIDACARYDVPAVILDSAVGYQATANVANRLAEIIICCMRPTTQFVDGTARYLESLDSVNGSPLGGRKKIVIVPNVVPQEKVEIDNHDYPDHAISRISLRLSDILNDRDEDDDITYVEDMLDEHEFGIPAVPSFMWREGQLYTQQKLERNEEIVLERYRKLAKIIHKL